MLHFTSNVRLAALAFVVAALALLGSTLATSPRQAEAVNITDPEGILCLRLSGLATGIGLVRIDTPTPATLTFTSQVYIQGAQALPDCQDPVQDPIPADATPFPATDAEARPALTGTWTNATDTVAADVCQPNFNFGPLTFPYGKVIVNFALAKPPAKSGGTFTLEGPYTDAACTVQGAGFNSFPVTVSGARYLDGPDALVTTFNSNWDKDGMRDWDELAPGNPACFDPFKTPNCQGVGGVAELPDAATTPLEAADSSGMGTGLIAAIAAGATAVAFGAAWYARRRLGHDRAR